MQARAVTLTVLKNMCLLKTKPFPFKERVQYVRMNRYRMMKLAANKHKAHMRPYFAYKAHYCSKFKSCKEEGAYS